ncbi:hypothetical protein MPH_06575 [Macrophomina phaseolina MS6]|uniref:Extracellular membrane protein CFEM domain-containing protein n=1 Tax=Macrophomina phaseolina (strain MS6) TaxID=1126212 RepID=K2RU62_MACPH|nr:hypothetical protein MPH_06575 [Macrophomina phaseolina MS6]
MFSKTIVSGLALSALISVGAAQDCPQNGPASSLFQSCGQVQGSMNVCTTGAVTSCSCSVLAHQSACYQSYKDNYCSNWVYQNDYFSANCGDNYADETSSTRSSEPASTSAEATTTADSSGAAQATGAAGSFGLDSLLMAGGLLAALF